MANIEIWRDIPGFEGRYAASNLGHIKSLARKGVPGKSHTRKQDRIMSSRIDKYGYLSIKLMDFGKPLRTTVHRLIAKTWVDNPAELPQVNHLDGVKTNNASSNLEWCTPLENVTHSILLGLKRVRSGPSGKFVAQPGRRIRVVQLNPDGSFVAVWPTATAAARAVDSKAVHHIGKCCRKEMALFKGFVWKYENEEQAFAVLKKYKQSWAS